MADVDVFAAAMDDFGADFNINARLLIPVVKTAIGDRSFIIIAKQRSVIAHVIIIAKTAAAIRDRSCIITAKTAISDRSFVLTCSYFLLKVIRSVC